MSVSLLLAFGCMTNAAWAESSFVNADIYSVEQSSECTGVVKDVNGDPLVGASVVVKGNAAQGSISDENGAFSLKGVKNGATLTVSYIGYVTRDIKWNGSSLVVILDESANNLDEAVVVGYGVQKKANLTGSVSNIKAEQIASRPVSSASAAMAGTMPGVTAIQQSGAPGSQKASITVRGKNTINAASPLVIVDGVPGSMDNIDPQDIESISVLKDAASSAIYGVQAASGVILITTKKGKKGDKPTVNYSGNVSMVSPTTHLHFLGSADYARLYNEAQLNDNPSAIPAFSEEDIRLFENGTDPYGHPNTDWYKETFKPMALETQHNVNITGGSQNTTYMASVGYTFQDGLSKNLDYERFNARTNVETKVNRWLGAGLNASGYRGIKEDGYVSYASLLQHSNRIAPIYPAYNQDGSFAHGAYDNPVAEMEGNTGIARTTDNQVHLTGHVDFTIIEGLTVKGVFSVRHDNQDYYTFKSSFGATGNTYDYGIANRAGNRNKYDWNWYTTQVLANYDKSFGKHNINVLLGAEQQLYTYQYSTLSRTGGGSDELMESISTLDGATQKNTDGGNQTARQSYFGRFQYNWASRYLLEVNLRADASSRFPKENRWGIFPAVSAGWRLSEEAFIKDNAEWIDNLKLRLGWGKTGNEEISEIYPAVATYAYGTSMFGSTLYSSAYESRYVNSNLKWATVMNYEFGLEGSFFGNKLSFEVNAYRKNTDGMLLNLPIQGVIGMKAPAQNAGKVMNRGVDVLLSHQNRIGDWNYGASLNFNYNHNEIVDMVGTEGADPNDSKLWFLEGEAIGTYYGYKANGLFTTQEELDNYPKRTGAEKLGDIKYVDINKDGKINSDDRTVIGRNFPAWTGGLNLNVGWKGLDLSMLFQGAFDVDCYYTGEATYAFFNSGKVLTKHMDRWHESNPTGTFPRLSLSSQINYQTNSYWLEDNSYVRLKNITLGYTLPSDKIKKLGISSLRFFLSGENLLTFSHLDGIDPEFPTGRGAAYGNVKKGTFGVKVSF